MRKHQGDFRGAKSGDEIQRDYDTFFSSDTLDVLQDVGGKLEKHETREQLCIIFQVTVIFKHRTPNLKIYDVPRSFTEKRV